MNKEDCLSIFERYISGIASEKEVAQLVLFLKEDSKLGEWLENEISNSSEKIDLATKVRMLENIRSQTNYNSAVIVKKRENEKLKSYVRWISNVAAVLFPVIILLGVYLYLKPQKVEPFEVAANMGEKANVTLSEGTKIAINSDSKITYYSDYNKKVRNIELDGEAYFEVSHNPDKPFVVQSKEIKVKVLGTSFGIKAYEDEDNISVVLNTGKIQLITPKEEIVMNPNDRIVYNRRTQVASLEKVNAEDYNGWAQNRLRFENESLETIMKTISRMHNIEIVFEDTSLKNHRFTGTIDNTNIQTVMHAIKLTSPVNYKLKDGIVYLYENK